MTRRLNIATTFKASNLSQNFCVRICILEISESETNGNYKDVSETVIDKSTKLEII